MKNINQEDFKEISPIQSKLYSFLKSTNRKKLAIAPEALGSDEFKKAYGVKYAYLSGSMYRGVASKQMVVAMGKAGLMGFLGTGGLSLDLIEKSIQFIQKKLQNKKSYGMNMLRNHGNKKMEMDTVLLYLKYGVNFIEASGFNEITPSLVRFRLAGLRHNLNGEIDAPNKIIAKVSRTDIAAYFMKPAPDHIVKDMLSEGSITQLEAILSQKIPLCSDICVAADSGGHTDRRLPTILLPSILKLRNKIAQKYFYFQPPRVGLSGGIGTPEAAAAAFIMGAEFILTGSINQCTVEAGTSGAVKSLLQNIDINDTAYAPAGENFESGSIIQVLQRGVNFPDRAKRLYEIYHRYSGLDDIPNSLKTELEQTFFKKPLTEIWQETRSFFLSRGIESEIHRAEKNPKHKLALVLRWYFGYSNRIAFEGEENLKKEYQIHTGPALGAFNEWVQGTELENWVYRHVDEIAEKLMCETANLLSERLNYFLEKTDLAQLS